VTWYRIEGNMPQHQKYAPLSDAAFRLAITAGAWCANMMTDGRLPKSMVAGLTRAPAAKQLSKTVQELVDAKIWDVLESDIESFYIHDFLDWNMSRAQWQAKKAAGSAGGKAKAAAKQKQPPKQKPSKRLAPASDSLEQNSSTSSSAPLADSDSDSDLRSREDPEEKKEDLPRSPNGEPTAGLDHKNLIAHYAETFTALRGEKPAFGGREAKAAKALLDSVGRDLERAKSIVTNAYQDSFWGPKITILDIAKDPSKFIGSNGKMQKPLFSPPQPNDESKRYPIRGL
jgi:hypothetical protein